MKLPYIPYNYRMPLVFGGFVVYFGIPSLIWGPIGPCLAYIFGACAVGLYFLSRFIVENYWRDK